MAKVRLSISGRPLPPLPKKFTTEDLVYPDDPEGSPDCIEILPDGRHIAEGDIDGEWFEVDPVTNEMDFDKPIEPGSLPAYLR